MLFKADFVYALRMRRNAEFRSYYRRGELRHTSPNFWPSSLPPVMTKPWKSTIFCKPQAAPTVLGVPPTTPPCAARSPLPILAPANPPRETRGPPISLPRPRFAVYFPKQPRMGCPVGLPTPRASARLRPLGILLLPAAEVFANYLVIGTLAPKVVNLLASPAETVKFKRVSLAFQATALISKREDN